MLFWQVRGGQDKKGHDDAFRIPPYQYEDRKTAALIPQSRRIMGRDNALLYDVFFSFAVVRQFLLYGTKARTGLGILSRMLVKFRLTIFLNASQRSIPGGVRVGKVTDCINVNGSVCAPQNTH